MRDIFLMSNLNLTVYRFTIYSLAMSVKGRRTDGFFTVLFDKGMSRGWERINAQPPRGGGIAGPKKVKLRNEAKFDEQETKQKSRFC